MNPALPKTRIDNIAKGGYKKYDSGLAKLKSKVGITKKGRAG